MNTFHIEKNVNFFNYILLNCSNMKLECKFNSNKPSISEPIKEASISDFKEFSQQHPFKLL